MQSRSAPSSNTEAVTKRLRHLIMTGDISPGDRLTEVGLARLLDVSRTPVREALQLLTATELAEKAATIAQQAVRGLMRESRKEVDTLKRAEKTGSDRDTCSVMHATFRRIIAGGERPAACRPRSRRRRR